MNKLRSGQASSGRGLAEAGQGAADWFSWLFFSDQPRKTVENQQTFGGGCTSNIGSIRHYYLAHDTKSSCSLTLLVTTVA